MIKGSNRRMFRKPGRARQAIGILASSKELMDAAQTGEQAAMQPVQSFSGGGIANNIYSELDLYGGVAPGFEMVGEGDAATVQPIGGLEGSLARLYGMRDPSRVRSESGFDLLELGARIAAGGSDSTTQNIANALIPTIDKIGKRREKNLATDIAVAQLKDKKDQEARDRLEKAYASQRKVNLKFSKELSQIGAAVDGQTGLITYGAPVDGQLPFFKDMQALQAHLRSLGKEGESDLRKLTDSIQREGGTVGERLYDDLTNPDIDLQAYLQKVELGKTEDIDNPRELKIFVSRLEGAVQQKGGVIIRPSETATDTRILDFNAGKALTPFGAQDFAFNKFVTPDDESSLLPESLKGVELMVQGFDGTQIPPTAVFYTRNGGALDSKSAENVRTVLNKLLTQR
jgi:hypothetical protein